MGFALWVAGIFALALKINADEAKAHEPHTPPPVVAHDTTNRQDTLKVKK